MCLGWEVKPGVSWGEVKLGDWVCLVGEVKPGVSWEGGEAGCVLWGGEAG